MVSYKWSSDIHEYRTTFSDEFKRLSFCKAATFDVTHIDNGEYNAKSHVISHRTCGLVSYDTPIIVFNYYHDKTTNKDGLSVHVNAEQFNCSNTTIHQLSRYLNERGIGITSYHMLKEIVKYYYAERFMKHIRIDHLSVPTRVCFVDATDLRYEIESLNLYWHTNVIE